VARSATAPQAARPSPPLVARALPAARSALVARSGATGRGTTPFLARPKPALYKFPCTGRKWQWAARQCEASATASGDRPAQRRGTPRPLPPAAKTAATGRAQAARSWPEAGRTTQDGAATFQALEQRASERQRASDCATGPARTMRASGFSTAGPTSRRLRRFRRRRLGERPSLEDLHPADASGFGTQNRPPCWIRRIVITRHW